MSISRHFVALPSGTVHYAAAGPADAEHVLLLHQTPRSWREYQDVLPRLSTSFRCLAMDTAGFGDSDALDGEVTIERWAGVAAELLGELGVERAHVVGHHTGGVIAVELAASRPSLVADVVLSSTPYTGPEFRAARAERPPIDEVSVADDGSHLAELWQRRQAFYPQGRPDLLHAFVRDALVVLHDVERGHRAVGSYRMEDRIGLVRQHCLVIGATDDPFAYPHGSELRAHLTAAASVTNVDIRGGMVPLPDQMPDEFSAAVERFLLRRSEPAS